MRAGALIQTAILAVASVSLPAAYAATTGPTWACASTRALESITYRVDNGPEVAVARNLGLMPPGSVVRVSFTVRPGCSGLTVSLAAYASPGADFDMATAPAQRLLYSASRTLGPGRSSLQVAVPTCYFQLNLARGRVLQQLGPAGTGNYYASQRRLVAAGKGGRSLCSGTATALRSPPPAALPPPPVIPAFTLPAPAGVPAASPVSYRPQALSGASPISASTAAASGDERVVFLPFTGRALATQLAIVLLLLTGGMWLMVVARHRERPICF
jgi:hypothetical protein